MTAVPLGVSRFCFSYCKKLQSYKNAAFICRYFNKSPTVLSGIRTCHSSSFDRIVQRKLQRCVAISGSRHNSNDVKLQNCEESPETNAEVVSVTFITHKGEEFPVKGKVGDNLLVLAQESGLDVDGACCRQLKCTTCHMYIEDDYFNKVEEASEQELDLLDTAKFLKPNSRLSCQIHLTKDHEGMRVHLPLGTVNFYVDGHKPAHH